MHSIKQQCSATKGAALAWPGTLCNTLDTLKPSFIVAFAGRRNSTPPLQPPGAVCSSAAWQAIAVPLYANFAQRVRQFVAVFGRIIAELESSERCFRDVAASSMHVQAAPAHLGLGKKNPCFCKFSS
uniref:Uncharacterized protein n=1 Tax=Eutreptiella gymnastica TaxID=73025 RepID=A0A7S4G1P7_9EUGL